MNDYEQKYKEALEKAKECLKDGTITNTAISYIETIFPELQENEESEGEKIREKLIDTFNFYDPAMNSPYLLGINRNDIVAWLEKQDEQKPTNNVEPKFKAGDWITIKE